RARACHLRQARQLTRRSSRRNSGNAAHHHGGQAMSDPAELIEGEDYYLENGNWVFTARYLLRRGYCCGSGCRHCPYKSGRENERTGTKPSFFPEIPKPSEGPR